MILEQFGHQVAGALAVDGTSLASLGEGLWSYGSFVLSEQWTATTMGVGITRNSEKPVPEIDPAGIASVLSLVVGALGIAERRLRRGRRGDRAAG